MRSIVMMLLVGAAPVAAAPLPAPVVAAPVVATGGWSAKETTSKLDDTVSYFATLASTDTVTDILGQPQHAHLDVGCEKGRVTVLVDWPDFVQPGEYYISMLSRADKGQLMRTTGMDFTTRSASMTGKPAVAWFRNLANTKTLVLSVPDKHGGQEASFDLAGIDAVEAKLNEPVCHA